MGQIVIKVPGRINREFIAERKETADAVLAFLDELARVDEPKPARAARRRNPAYPTEEEFQELVSGIGADLRRNGLTESNVEDYVRQVRAERRRRAA